MVSYRLAATQHYVGGGTRAVLCQSVRHVDSGTRKTHRPHPRTLPDHRKPFSIVDLILEWTVAVMTWALNSVRSAEMKKVSWNACGGLYILTKSSV